MRTIDQRINIIIGQLEGIKKMREQKESCPDLVVQLKSIKSGISSVMEKILEEELNNCLLKECPGNKSKIAQVFSEILKK